ncbi:MAG: catalase [Thiothrix sp.]|nr:MAG: catalase [Thiothrix sp.]
MGSPQRITINKKLKYTHIILCSVLLITSCTTTPAALEIAREYPKPGEKETTQGLINSLTKNIIEKYAGTTMLRDAHPKHHGCVRAQFSVPKLPPELRVGLFRQPGEYSSWIRYSTATESVDHDKQKAMLGMAVKVIGVDGEKLLEDEKNAGTQDILMLSHPVLPIRNAEDFLEVVNEKVWFFANPFDLHLHELGIAMDSRKHHTSPLEIRYWSTTPYSFGEGKAIKYSAKPCTNTPHELPKKLAENYLQETMIKQLEQNEVCYDLMVQLQTDANTMPIEDATIVWNEATSPFQKVARITIPSQEFSSDKQMEFCENISMTPWHSLVEHRPLGSINRARKDVYREISNFRHNKNNTPQQEPTGLELF